MDGIRGLAALAVAWFHLYQRNEQLRPGEVFDAAFNLTSAWGWLGVQAFFVVTGFVIPYSLRVRRSPGGLRNAGVFLAKRALRLYPPFLAAVLLTFAIIFAAPMLPFFRGWNPVAEPEAIISNILLIAPFVGQAWSNPVFWTLLVEVQFYLVVAALFALSPLVKAHGFAMVAGFCALACFGAAIAPYQLHSALTWAPFFVVGYVLYEHMIEERYSTILMGLAAIATVSIVFSHGLVSMVPTLITVGLILLRWSPGPALLLLGAMSYSLYLIHYPIGVRAVRLFARFDIWGIEVLAYAASMALVLALSWIFFILIEKPALDLSRSVQLRRV